MWRCQPKTCWGLLLLLMLMMRIVLATVWCILGSSGKIFKLEFGQYFAADVLQRLWSWILVEILKMKFDQDLGLNLWYDPTGYSGKMNSTLGSVVPLAMFQNIGQDHHSKPLNLDASCFRHRSKCIQLDKSSLWSGGWSQNIMIVSTSKEPQEFYIQRQGCIAVITFSI